MKLFLYFLMASAALVGCLHTATDFEDKKAPATTSPSSSPCSMHLSLKNKGLINVQQKDPRLHVHLRYSTRNNFLGKDIYGCLDSAYVQPLMADMLKAAQDKLSAIDTTLHLMIWDAVRPRSVQWQMWNALDMPFEQKVKYVSNPKNGSVHNYGCAVDLTICRANGDILNMGTDFDHFGQAAHTINEYLMVSEGTLTYRQLDNRKLLRKVMTEAGFSTISSEWWHYNALSRSAAQKKYAIVE